MGLRDTGQGQELKKGGFLEERLWVILLPVLLLLSLAGATWTCLQLRQRDEVGQVATLENSLKAAVHRVSADVGRAVETGARENLTFMVESLASATGASVTLRNAKGTTLAQSHARGKASLSDAPPIGGDISQQIVVWGPAIGVGGKKVGEIRIHTLVPTSPPFPWALWSSVLAVFGLISAGVLLLVTRVLAPVARLGDLFREIGTKSPQAVQIPRERLAEFGQLRQEIIDCVDGLKARSLRAEESFVEVAFSLSREYEYHREGTIGHGQRTRRYASWIAERLRLPPKERDALEVASLCHDVGRLPSGESNAWQSGDNERMHPILGAAFFEAMPGLEDVARIIRSHHEDFDGTGYPEQLSGEDIPIGARILRIADAFERLYNEEHPEIGLQDALSELEEGKDHAFDPYLFEFFREEVAVHMLERRRLKVTLKAYQAGMANSK